MRSTVLGGEDIVVSKTDKISALMEFIVLFHSETCVYRLHFNPV